MDDKKEDEKVRKKLEDESKKAFARRTLNIWEVPADKAEEFVHRAKSEFKGKSWMYLCHLMEKEIPHALLLKQLDLLDSRLANIEMALRTILSEEPEEHEVSEKKDNSVKVFGGKTISRKVEQNGN